MDTIFGYTLTVAVIAGILATVFTLNKGAKAFGGGLLAAFLGALSEFLFLYFVMPLFAHWTNSGYIVTGIIALVAAILGAYIVSNEGYDSDYGGVNILVGLSTVATVCVLIGAYFSVPPAWMDNEVWDEIAMLANVQDATQEDRELAATDSDLLKVSPAHANLEAKGEMPDDVGSYAEVDTSFEQTINGEQYYVTDLNVTNDRGFRSKGSALPGYFIRPAKDVDAPTNFVPGFSLKYVPDAWWNEDLKRHVYLNYTLSCKCEVENLTVLEVDDDGNPMYTGTVWEYTIGNVGMVATKVIVVDPTTGTITEYPIAETPEWIDRIYSLEKMRERIEWWATYSEWEAKFAIQDKSGKMVVDKSEDVYGADGRLDYMITVTSSGADQTLRYDMRVDPKTGEVIKFPASGKTLQAVDDLIDEQTYTEAINTALGAEPIECERQRLLGEWTYYCILQSRSEGEGSSGAMVGYAFLQERFTSSPNKVIVADNFADAWNFFRLQITQGSGDAEVQGDSADLIVAKGIVIFKGDQPTEGMVWFVVSTEKNPEGLYFRVSQDNPVIALTQIGHTVEVTAFDLRVDEVNDVMSLINLELPPLKTSP